MIKIYDKVRNLYKKSRAEKPVLFDQRFDEPEKGIPVLKIRSKRRFAIRALIPILAIVLVFGINLFLIILLKLDIARTNDMLIILASRSKKLEGSLNGSKKSISEIYTNAEMMKEKLDSINYRVDDIDSLNTALNDIINTVNNISLNEMVLDKKLRITMLRVSSMTKAIKKISGESESEKTDIEKSSHLIRMLAYKLNSTSKELEDLKNLHRKIKAKGYRPPQGAPQSPTQRVTP